MDWHFIMSRRLYFGLLRNISNIHWKYFNFFTSPFFFNSLLFCKRFDCVFSKLFFFPDRDPMRQVFGEKKTFSGASVQLCHADLILACHAKVLISFDRIRCMIRDPIRHPIGDPVPDPICDSTRSDPDFVDAELP